MLANVSARAGGSGILALGPRMRREDHDSDVVANALVALHEIMEDEGGLEVQ